MLDEADEMLSKGFKEQIYDVYRYLPPETQVRACGGRGYLVAGPPFRDGGAAWARDGCAGARVANRRGPVAGWAP